MFRTALRNVFAHKARLLMTVLAVMLGVAFVSGTLVFTDTLGDAYRNSSAKSFDTTSVAVRPDDSAIKGPEDEPALTDTLVKRLGKLPGVEAATGSLSGFAAVAGRDGNLIGEGWSTLGGNYAPDSSGKDARYRLTDGTAPQGEDRIAIDSHTAERAGFKVGDTVRMSVDGPVMEPKISAIFDTDDGNVAVGGTLVLFDSATTQTLFGKPGQYDEIALRAAPGTSQSALRAEVDKVIPESAEAVTGKSLADDQAAQIESGTQSLNSALLAFAAIALFVGVFIIANTFTMLVAQRTKELALLRAVGASRRQVTRSVLIEALIVGLVAGAAGLLAGIGIGAGMRALVGQFGGVLPDGSLIIAPRTFAAALAVGVGVTVLAAWLPARRAAKIPPVAAMSSVHAPPTARGLVVRNSIGSALSGLGIAAVLAAVSMGTDGKLQMGAGAALLLIGVFVLTPLLSRPVIAAAAPALRLFGVSGKLARQNSVRNPRRTAATASALMIGLTLITGLTVIANSTQKAIDAMATDSLKADYAISMATYTDLSPEVEKTLAKMPAVTASSPMRTSRAEIDGSTENLTGVDPTDIGELLSLGFSAGALSAMHGDSVVADTATAKLNHWKTGDTVPVTYYGGDKGELTIGGIYQGNELISGLLLDEKTLSPHLETVADRQVLVRTHGGATEANKDAIAKALGDNPAVKIQDQQDISNEISSQIGLLLNMLYALLGMAVVIAVIGVVNTLAMSVFERSQEIGMLRAIGLDRAGIKRMVRLESLVISLYGGVLGIGLGVFLGWAGGEVIADALDGYTMALPWDRMAVFLGMAVVVGMLAAVWPARRAARLNMLTAIKAE